jgi:hypothetical protein
MTDERIEYMMGQMQTAFPEALIENYEALIPAMTNARKDRHVLAAAVMAKAQVIVTENIRDFPDHALSPFRIEAISPDDFLRDLLDLYAERMVEVLMSIVERRKMPPKSVDELLVALEHNGCSGYAQDLRETLKHFYADK